MPLIDPGSKAPTFSLPDQDGKMHSLEDHAGETVVLFFYPKDMTSGCTKEACAFRDLQPEFKKGKGKATVFGISPQDVASKAKFAAAESLNFPVLADDESKVCDAYGVWQTKSMYGRSFKGVVRSTYLIGPDGTIVRRWDKVKVPRHAEEVLEAVRDLAAQPA